MTTPNHRLLLWDIDGTLITSGGAGMRAMEKVGAKMFGDHCQWDGIESAGQLDPHIFAEFAQRNSLNQDTANHHRFRDRYLKELETELVRCAKHVAALPGVHDILPRLKQRQHEIGDVVQGMLTGNYAGAVPIKMKAVGIDMAWFTITAFGDEGKTRADLVALAMKKHAAQFGVTLAPKRVIVIGDTPRDIACAHAHGCIAFCVATGIHSVSQLKAAGADYVIKDFADAKPLLDLIDEV